MTSRNGPKTLQRWILTGLAAGIVLGLAANLLTSPDAPLAAYRGGLENAVREGVEPVGKIFLRLLFLTVLPLVFSSLVLGVHELRDMRELGRIGLRTLAFTVVLSAISVGIGLSMVNVLSPGKHISMESRQKLLSETPQQTTEAVKEAAATDVVPRLESIVNSVIPRNPVEAAAHAFDGDMLAVMFFALLFGIGLGAGRSARTASVVSFLEGIYDVSMWLVGFAMRLAPVGVAALVFSVTSRMGVNVLLTLGAYVIAVLLGLGLQQFLVYPLILRFACGTSPYRFFQRIRPVMVTAFSTSSSNATLPTTIQVARQRLGIPPKIANFVLTLGSTFNQNGTALFEGVTVIFIAQAYGVPLGFEKQLLVLVMAILAGVGTAGVPGASIPLIVPVLVSVQVPAEGIALILGVDRFLDMCRTVVNVTGDLVAASFVALPEGPLKGPGPPRDETQ